MQTAVLEAIKKYGSDPVLLFWKSFGLIMEGIESALYLVSMKCVFDQLLYSSLSDNLPEGMRELENLLDKRDLVVCVPLLLVHAHKKCKIVGKLISTPLSAC